MRALSLLLVLAGCRTTLDAEPADLAIVDLAGADLSTPPDLARCVPPVDAGASGCPCGSAGLCRPATGRLSVQVQTLNGPLALIAMDDNGCNRHVVSSDTPVGVPRWAKDGQRLAYITAYESSVLNVIGVAPDGHVSCRGSTSLSDTRASELAWAGDHEWWLLGPGVFIARWRNGPGVLLLRNGEAQSFDGLPGAGPLVSERPGLIVDLFQALDQPPKTLYTDSQNKPGTIRLSPTGDRIVFTASGIPISLLPVSGGMPQPLGIQGRSPAFALDGKAIVYTTDDGNLRYHYLDTHPNDDTIPSTWKSVYSPDWTPMPASCDPLPDCN